MAISRSPQRKFIRRSQLITSTGTFTLPAGYGTARPFVATIKLAGGGGGGGGGAWHSTNTLNEDRAAGGGGGGSGVCLVYEDLSFTGNLSFVIGAGGSGGSGATGLPGNGNNGTNGGTTSLNSTFFGPGGGYGSGGRCATNQLGGHDASEIWVFNTNFEFYIASIGSSFATSVLSVGFGGAGGSGGAGNSETAVDNNPDLDTMEAGGSYGRPGKWLGRKTVTTLDTGSGLSILLPSQNFTTTNIIGLNILPIYTRRDFNQAGGGGGGGSFSSFRSITTAGAACEGGFAGGRIGGRSGRGVQSATTVGTINGQAATFLSAGGGGGGARWRSNAGTNGGNGGAGAAGYAEIIWTEEAV